MMDAYDVADPSELDDPYEHPALSGEAVNPYGYGHSRYEDGHGFSYQTDPDRHDRWQDWEDTKRFKGFVADNADKARVAEWLRTLSPTDRKALGL